MSKKLKTKSGVEFNDYILKNDSSTALEVYRNSSYLEKAEQQSTDITTATVLRYIFLLVLICGAFSLFINFFHVAFTQYNHVDRFRQVAIAELAQDCCKITMKDNLVSFEPKKVADCHRILQEEKKNKKANRCEAAEDVIKEFWFYQWILEIWFFYFPMARLSVMESVFNFAFSTIASGMGTYLVKKTVFSM